MVVFGQSGCIPPKLVALGKSCCFRQKRLYLEKSGGIPAKVVFIRAKYLYSGKVVAFVKK